jgi:hypothetical protein
MHSLSMLQQINSATAFAASQRRARALNGEGENPKDAEKGRPVGAHKKKPKKKKKATEYSEDERRAIPLHVRQEDYSSIGPGDLVDGDWG